MDVVTVDIAPKVATELRASMDPESPGVTKLQSLSPSSAAFGSFRD